MLERRPLANRLPGLRFGAEALADKPFLVLEPGAGTDAASFDGVSLRTGRLDLRARPVARLVAGRGRVEAGPLTVLELLAEAGVRRRAGTGGT